MNLRVSGLDGVQSGHENLYWFRWNVHTSSVSTGCVALHRSACSRGYKYSREGFLGPKSLYKTWGGEGMREAVPMHPME
jgi:hypothetical protein